MQDAVDGPEDGNRAGGGRLGRELAARLLASVALMLVAGCVGAGWWHADRDRAGVMAAAARLPTSDGRVVFVVPRVPEGFIRYVSARVPAGDPVQYVAPGLALCGTARPRYAAWRAWMGQVFWLQYRLAPRPSACGAAVRWRIYLGQVPPGVSAADRWSPTLAVVPAHRR